MPVSIEDKLKALDHDWAEKNLSCQEVIYGV